MSKFSSTSAATAALALALFAPLGFTAEPARPDQAPPRQDERPRGDRPPRGDKPGKQAYTLEQACSDRAQLHTISFSGLAFLTGDFGASTFIPPGKVCDYFGFQYLRDIDATGKGHNPMFLDRVVGNVLTILDAAQQQQFLDLAKEQGPQLEELARMRLPVVAAFHGQADGKVPPGSAGLNEAAVTAAVGAIFRRDAELSLRRAEVIAAVARSLTPAQRETLGKMKFGDFTTWPAKDVREVMKAKTRGLPHMVTVSFMTYASEFFSWTAGSLEADTYFCPERHATYFGGFYMKDMPAMGKRDFDISTTVTGESGRILVEELLDPGQRSQVTSLVDRQRPALAEIVTLRRSIATSLRTLLEGKVPDREKLLALGQRYGELDGVCSYRMAMAFATIKAGLTADQKVKLMKLRNLDGYTSAPYYIYSRAEKTPIQIDGATAALFAAPQK